MAPIPERQQMLGTNEHGTVNVSRPGRRAWPPFVGRDTELACLNRLLEHARQGRAGLVVIEGPAGIGKTALVRRFLDQARDSWVLHASGEEAEQHLSLGVIEQLARYAPTALARPLIATVRNADHGTDPVLAGAELLDVLGALQQHHAGVVAIVIDDAHWADRASLHALAFTLRRLRLDRALTLLLLRDANDPHMPDGLSRLLTSDHTTRLMLSGLRADELHTLSGELGPRLSLSAAKRLRTHTDGNPLHVRALLHQFPTAAFEAFHTPLPAPRSFAALVLARLAACPDDVRAFVEATSVLGTRCELHHAATLSQVADPVSALEHAILADLLVEESDTCRVQFCHPLVHAAVYRGLGPCRRRALHARAAALSVDDATRLRHRARAASIPDHRLAMELAESGRRSASNGDWTAAGEQLAAAAHLTPAALDRQQLVLEAVECRLLTGEVSDLSALTAEVRVHPASGWRSYILARIALIATRIEEAHSLLEDAWQRCSPDAEPALGARIAAQLATFYVLSGRGRDSADWADRALRLAPGRAATDMLRFVALSGLGFSGQADAALASIDALPAPTLATVTDLDTLLGRGILRLWTDDLTGACDDLSGVLAAGHDRSAAFRLSAADTLANVEYRLGRWGDATTHSQLALSLADDASQRWLSPLCHATAAIIAAPQGRCDEADAHARRAQRGAGPGYLLPLAYAAAAAAHVARARHQPEAVIAALEPLRRLSNHDCVAEPCVVAWQDMLADAFIAIGDLEQADAVLRPFEARAAQRRRHSAMAAAARVRGNLHAARGNPDRAEDAFATALEHAANTQMPYERARLQLAYGAFLRRAGRRNRAAAELRAAHMTLARLDARPDLERCTRELAACGVPVQRQSSATRTDLTPRELAVARLVVDGLTNRQVARELVISVKTVEYHLGHVFTKLQVTSRVQMASRLNHT